MTKRSVCPLLLCAPLFLTPAPVKALTVADLAVSPTSVRFATMPIGAKSIYRIHFEFLGRDGYIEINSVSFSGSGATVTALNLPLSVSTGQIRGLDLVAIPSATQFAGSLLFKTSVGDVTLPVDGQGICLDPVGSQCDPPGPLCVVDLNAYPVVSVSNPNLLQDTAPAIRQQSQTHQGADKNYELPLSLLWKIAGLEALLGQAPDACVVDPIHFFRVGGTQYVATFQWQNSQPPLPARVGTTKDTKVTVELPSTLSGWSMVYGTRSELHFDKDAGPLITVESMNTTWFKGEIECLTSGSSNAVLRNRSFSAGSVVPNLHLIIE